MIDTHVHLTDEKFENITQDVVARFKQAGVTRVVNVGYDSESSRLGKKLSDEYDGVYFSAGVHPDKEFTVTDDAIRELKELSKNEKCVAIGEIGLDYHFEPFSKEGQKRAFEKQIELACETGLPIIVHNRDSAKDLSEIIKSNKNLLKAGGVMHCFSGSKETAKEYLDMGFYISFSGVVTFKNARNLLEVASFVPSDGYLAETDCPYMAPEPMRGKVNEPSFVKYVYEKLAYLRGVDFKTVEKEVEENAKRLFFRIR